ncbi:11822_t:CDS:2 [Gigaspora rosea]|nr:11822_t:CDS:2 [Gigaspora rosea]
MVFIETLVEGKIPVKALIDIFSKFNTISKRLFDKLKSNHGIRPFCSLVNNLYGDVIDGMCIPLIDENFNKVSPSKNNSPNSMESRSDPTLEEFVDMFKKLSLRNKDNMHRKNVVEYFVTNLMYPQCPDK